MPKISIIIPIYGVEKYIRQALDSVVNQTFSDIEIICINDCTLDKSFEIVKEYALNDNRFVLLEHSENKGQGVARNWGIDIAKGEYIMFLDPDDWYELNACEEAYKQITENKNEMVLFGYYRDFENCNERFFLRNMLSPYDDYLTKKQINLRNLKTPIFQAALTVMYIYRKDFLNKNNIRYGCTKIGEDIIFATETLACSSNISVIDKPLYNYRKRKGSSGCNYKAWEKLFEVRKECYQNILSNNKNMVWFERNYIIYLINSMSFWFKTFSRNDKKIAKDFYLNLRQIFVQLNDNYNISEIKDYLGWKNYDTFNLCVKNKYLLKYKIERGIYKVARTMFGGKF